MKIEVLNKPKQFDPVTITIETEGELNFFRDVLGDTHDFVGKAYGIDNFYELYKALDKVFEDRDIKRKSATHVTYEQR